MNKLHKLMVALMAAIAMHGCDDTPVGPSTPERKGTDIHLSGRIALNGAKAQDITISTGSVQTHPDANGNYILVGTRSFAGRTLADSILDEVHVVVHDTDTLQSIPVTSWSGILPTSYIVQRNISATLPIRYSGSNVYAGYYNTQINPGVYSSVQLGRAFGTSYSGFIYTAYDSAEYANASYLYSAVVIVRTANDSVLAFSDSVATVTARLGDIPHFDSTHFVTKLRTDSAAIRPWWTATVPNGTDLLLIRGRDVIVSRDSTMVFDTSVNVAGRLLLSNVHHDSISLVLGNARVKPDSSGKFSLTGNIQVTGALSDGSVGLLYVIANNHDTLHTYRLGSWTTVVAAMQIVRSDISVSLPSSLVGKSVTVAKFDVGTKSGSYVAWTGVASGRTLTRSIYTVHDSSKRGALYAIAAYSTTGLKLNSFVTSVDTVSFASPVVVFDSSDFASSIRTDSTLLRSPWWSKVSGISFQDTTSLVLHRDSIVIFDTIVVDSGKDVLYNENVELVQSRDTNGKIVPNLRTFDSAAIHKVVATLDTFKRGVGDTVMVYKTLQSATVGLRVFEDSSNARVRICGRYVDSVDIIGPRDTEGRIQFVVDLSSHNMKGTDPSLYNSYFPVVVLLLRVELVRKTVTVLYR